MKHDLDLAIIGNGRTAALAACPAPDILVNNADGAPPGDFRQWTPADWHAAIDAMMIGPIDMIRRTVDSMIERRFGRIVNIVSRSVKTPQLELGLSNGARSGLVGFVAGLARQTRGPVCGRPPDMPSTACMRAGPSVPICIQAECNAESCGFPRRRRRAWLNRSGRRNDARRAPTSPRRSTT